jgi:hypothetical protein
MPDTYHIRIAKERLVFSAAHFITFNGDECEPLHGHNYHVAAEIDGPIDENLYVVDFLAVRDALQDIVDELDHRVPHAAPHASANRRGRMRRPVGRLHLAARRLIGPHIPANRHRAAGGCSIPSLASSRPLTSDDSVDMASPRASSGAVQRIRSHYSRQ